MAFNKHPKIVTHYKDDFEYVSVNQTGNEVHIDMYDGEKKSHQAPTELLLSALASCAAVDVVEILKKRKKTFTDFRVEASGERRDDHPRAFTSIHLNFVVHSNNVKEGELLKSAAMVVDRYCSVATTINEKAALEVSVEIHEV